MITLLYFARLRESLGLAEERVVLPSGITSVAALSAWLQSRGEIWQLLQNTNVRVAVNQEMAHSETVIADGDEIAFFPPVTGG